MAENKAVPDFLAADVADMEANPTVQQPAAQPEPDQVESAPAEQQAPPSPDIEAIDGEDRGQFVRKAALYEERQRRKEATERSREWERRYVDDMKKAQERLETLFRNAQQPAAAAQPAQPKIPSLEEDPIGHFQAQNEELRRKLEDTERWRKSQEQASQQENQAQQISTEVRRLENEFAKAKPDYYQAHEHLQNAWKAEAMAIGIPEDQIPDAIRARAIETVQIAARLNRNPAEVAYQRAQALGYKGPQAPAAPALAPQKGPDLDRIARGMATSKSASAAAGAPAAGLQSIEAILSMPEEEFSAKFGSSDNRQWEREMKRIMGVQ
jgi:hypothetical protein